MVYYFHPALRDPQKQKAWEMELLYAIPAVEAAGTVEEYALALQGMIAKLGDGGTTVLFPGEVDESGELVATGLPIRLSRIDGQVVISAIDTSAPNTELLAVGMEVLSVDGVLVEDYLSKWLPVASGRTEALKRSWVFERLLSGRQGSEATVVLRTASGDEFSVGLARTSLDWTIPVPTLDAERVADGRFIHIALPSLLYRVDTRLALSELYGLAQRFYESASESDCGVILDLRAGTMEFGTSYCADVPLPLIVAVFADDSRTVSAGYGHRTHEGLRNPMYEWLSYSYGEDWTVRQGVPLWYASLSGDSSPLVVLIDGGSYSSVVEYLAPLQRAGQAVVVGETGIEPMRQSYTGPLPGGLGFRLRLSVPWDSEGAVRLPVVEVSPSVEDLRSGRDVALETAVAILDDWEKRGVLSLTSAPLIGESLVELPWSLGTTLDHEERLLGLFKLWSAIRYFYPFPEMIDGNWDDALGKFIPRVNVAGDDRAYYYELQHMLARINDGHALLDAQLPVQYRPPIEIREIEGQAVITRIDRGQSLGSPDLANLEVGMIIVRVDGRPVMELIAEGLVRIPSATDQHRRYLAFARLLTGQRSTDVRLEVASSPNEDSRTVTLSRTHLTLSSDPSPVSCRLEGGVGFIDLARIDKEGFEQAIGEFSSCEGLVLDLRGYPSSVGIGMVLDYLTDDETSISGWAHVPVVYSPDPRKRGWKMEAQRLEPGSIDAYEGEVVILTNASAGSAAEWLLICLESTACVTIVGEPTAGTTGDITFVEIPGPAYAGFTGMKVLHGDGSPIQGIGILPDVEVHPTIQGIREGRDEILERGLEVLQELIAQRKGND